MENPFAWMRRSALFVLSSAWEGLPGTLIQAMACAVPVVSTNCPSGPMEILENGKWGRAGASRGCRSAGSRHGRDPR
ncbi:MAG: glycosyltransferase [Candidatus Competibacter sp.]